VDCSSVTNFAICAKCHLSNLPNSFEICPACRHPLGPTHIPLYDAEFTTLAENHIPEKRDTSSITYEFDLLSSRFGFRLTGEGPSVVSRVGKSFPYPSPGTTDTAGDESHIRRLIEIGLHPFLGDVLCCIDGDVVLHLNEEEVRYSYPKDIFI
jgi:hypothetical protein